MSASPIIPNHIGQSRFARLTNVETGITAKAGGTQANSYQLSAAVSRVDTVASGNDGVRLPKIIAKPDYLGADGCSVGTMLLLGNNGSNALKVFGGLTDTINAVTSATGNAVAAGVNVVLVAADLNASTNVGTWLMLNAQAAAVAAITSGTIAGVAITDSTYTGVQGTPATATNTAGITAANILTGIILGTPTAAAAYTLPTGTAWEGAATWATNESFDWYMLNLATNATYIITLTAAAGHTIVGEPTLAADASTTGVLYGASAKFRTVHTATNTAVTYRLS